jgi:hypothetical protein
MPRPKRPLKPQRIPCAQCAREIPRSAAHTAEGKDYVLHFCGAGCRTRWQKSRSRGHAG